MDHVRAGRKLPIRKTSLFKFLIPFIALCLYFFRRPDSSTAPIERVSELSTGSISQFDDDFSLYSTSNVTLFKRDQYACKKGTPCKTYACCGSFFGTDTGECGFGKFNLSMFDLVFNDSIGPTFCGTDCDSQCDAKSECGQYADPPGKKCPLNVCCSEFGFCGSTAEFCDSKCQSNCVLDPPVPAGRSSEPVLSKVIGYYESWSARRTCRAFPPAAIPVQGLTHVNFAFAYIDPGSLTITTMDGDTPADLFAQTTNVRSTKTGSSGLQVFISIGGWTFSDNGTATQSVFPSIAGDAGKRQKFANNLVAFMTQYGFDGVDLDWEVRC